MRGESLELSPLIGARFEVVQVVERLEAQGDLLLGQCIPFEALLASGRLELIQNHQILTRLGKWPDWLEDIHTNDLSRREGAVLTLVPFLTARGWPDFDSWTCDSPPCVPSGKMPSSYLSMAREPELRALLYLRKASMTAAVSDHGDRIPEADQLLQLIKGELATR